MWDSIDIGYIVVISPVGVAVVELNVCDRLRSTNVELSVSMILRNHALPTICVERGGKANPVALDSCEESVPSVVVATKKDTSFPSPLRPAV